MLFGVHNHYNSNSNTIGDFSHPIYSFLIGEMPVRVTNQGLIIFNLNKKLQLSEKIKLAQVLDISLKTHFGTGLSFASSGLSTCVEEYELAPYYKAMKDINPSMITIYSSASFPGGKWVGLPKDLEVDHLLDSSLGQSLSEQLLQILQPQRLYQDRSKKDWEAFEDQVTSIFKTALSVVEASRQEKRSKLKSPHP